MYPIPWGHWAAPAGRCACLSAHLGHREQTFAVLQFSRLGCFGGVQNSGSGEPWPSGPREGSREHFKVRLRNSLGRVPEAAVSSLLFHWQVSRLVWFSLEAFLGTQLPREMPGTGIMQAACAPSSEGKSRSLLFMPPPLVAQAGREGAIRWET